MPARQPLTLVEPNEILRNKPITPHSNQMNIENLASEYIELAESAFGKMCSEWHYSGVEISSSPPHLRYYPESGSVKILLSEKVNGNIIQLHFQLAHEVCHLLYPTMSLSGIRGAPTVLNEGISTHFSVLMAGKLKSEAYLIQNLEDYNFSYYDALQKVRSLLRIDSKAIIKLREIQPKLNDISLSDFALAKINADTKLISSLLAEFK